MATTQDYIDYYANLLPAEYREQPNAYATIQTLAAMGLLPIGGNVVTDSNGNPVFSGGQVVVDGPYGDLLPLVLQSAFDIFNAVGQQLDFLAEAIGCKRTGFTLTGQYKTLDDNQFRLLCLAVSSRNYLKATTQAIVSFMHQFFPSIIRVQDQLNMHMSFNWLAALNDPTLQWAEFFVVQDFLPRPLGVGAGMIIGSDFFGMRTYNTPPQSWVRPMCTYAAPVQPAPGKTAMLQYVDNL